MITIAYFELNSRKLKDKVVRGANNCFSFIICLINENMSLKRYALTEK